MSKKITVLIVDDSKLIREILTSLFRSDPELSVVGTASNPYEARSIIKKTNPDVITLDIEMPKMDGLTFLDNLMRLRPTPVVMISTLTVRGAEATFKALALGAVDFIAKPKVNIEQMFSSFGQIIIDKVKMAARANVKALEYFAHTKKDSQPQAKNIRLDIKKNTQKQTSLIAIGASTGGTEAIQFLLSRLNQYTEYPPFVITQHIPPVFSTSYAQRLNQNIALNVVEVSQSIGLLKPNHVYLAPGDKHLVLCHKSKRISAHLEDSERVNHHKPSVDVMFNSINKKANQILAILLTGMGKDGAKGMKNLRDAGAITLVQDKDSSVVWGMPGAAVKIDAAEHILPLEKIADFINKTLSE